MNQMTESDIVIQLHNLARITTDSGISKELRALADRLAVIAKTKKQVEDSWLS